MFKNIITSKDRDPLGGMLLDYWGGKIDAAVHVESSTLEMWTMAGRTMFRTYDEMDNLEKKALSLCRGKILDVGAGSGCHSIYLQDSDRQVEAIDISPGCVDVMGKRGIKNVLHRNVFSLEEKKYDTILMLMNGIGICGSLDGCNVFLQFAQTILNEGGQILADSTDLSYILDLDFGASLESYFGETEFVMRYGNRISKPFGWVYIDFNTLRNIALFNSLHCQLIKSGEEGRYLVKIGGDTSKNSHHSPPIS